MNNARTDLFRNLVRRHPVGMNLSVENDTSPISPHPVGMRLREASLREAVISFSFAFLPKGASLTGCFGAIAGMWHEEEIVHRLRRFSQIFKAGYKRG